MRIAYRAAMLGIASGWTFGNTGPVARTIAADLDVSLAATGWLVTALLIAHAGSQVPAARPIERHGAFRVVRIGLVALVALNVLAALAPGFELLLGTRLLIGCATGPIFVGCIQGFRQLGGALAAGLFGGCATLGLALALLVGGAIEDAGGDWRLMLWLAAALALLALPVVPRAGLSAPGRPTASSGIRQVVRNPAIARLALLHTASFGTSLVVGAWIVTYLVDGGASGTVAGLLGFVMLGTAAVARPWGGLLLARGAGWVRVGAGGVLLAAIGLAVLAISPSQWLAIPAAVIGGLGLSLPFTPAFSGAALVEPTRSAGATAIVNLSASVFALVAVPLSGVDLEDGTGGTLTWGALAALAVLAAFLNRREPVAAAV